MRTIELWTDGSCKKNGQKGAYGGWGAVIIDEELGEYRACGREEATTNNIMEMTAMIKGLNLAKKMYGNEVKIVVYSDSAYILNCRAQRWYDNWIKNGWKRGKNEPVKNPDLWKRLLKVMEPHKVNFIWVKGHNGHPLNERCDVLATTAADGDNLIEDVTLT